MNTINIVSISAAIVMTVAAQWSWAGQESTPVREGPVSISALGGVSGGSGHVGAAAGLTLSVDVSDRVSLEGRSVYFDRGPSQSAMDVNLSVLVDLMTGRRALSVGGRWAVSRDVRWRRPAVLRDDGRFRVRRSGRWSDADVLRAPLRQDDGCNRGPQAHAGLHGPGGQRRGWHATRSDEPTLCSPRRSGRDHLWRRRYLHGRERHGQRGLSLLRHRCAALTGGYDRGARDRKRNQP